MSNTQKITYCRQKEEELLEIRLNVTQTPFLSSSLYDYLQALISSFSPSHKTETGSYGFALVPELEAYFSA